jgi:UDP-N-acetylmuramate: L-alanyl-gamma-D-glutamyl-meso-diaminopimelate ligase
MAGVARLAKEMGWHVTGSDAQVYPPMSDQLRDDGIPVMEGYTPDHLQPAPDCVVIGNALSRGNTAVEYVLDSGLPYTSGPAFLAQHVLSRRKVIAVAGTHGKTTTSSIVAWLLEAAGLEPGFLIGGVAHNFGISARLGGGEYFVVEADEYDTAFFDKRAKFVHYTPHTLILNNLEYDHADIFPDMAAIQWQFHQLLRIVPGNSLVIAPRADTNLQQVLQRGCWTPVEYIEPGQDGEGWHARQPSADGRRFDVACGDRAYGTATWSMTGRHNVCNALAAVAAARHAGVSAQDAVAALAGFKGVKRRMEVIATVGGVTLYDDFAHHPTAIDTTLRGLRNSIEKTARIIVVLEPRSNTMRLGVHRNTLAPALGGADGVVLFQPPELPWSLQAVADSLSCPARVSDSIDTIVEYVAGLARPGDHIVIMSNGGFGGIHQRIKQALLTRVSHEGA